MFGHQKLNRLRQPEQPEEIGNSSSVFARSLSDLLMAEFEIAAKPVERLRDFDRIQIFPLDVLNERYFKDTVVREFLNDYRDVMEICYPGGAPSSLTGHQHIAVIDLLNHKRLDYAVRSNGLCQLR